VAREDYPAKEWFFIIACALFFASIVVINIVQLIFYAVETSYIDTLFVANKDKLACLHDGKFLKLAGKLDQSLVEVRE